MTIQFTTRLALPYPQLSDTPDVVRDIQALALAVEAVSPMYSQGTFASRPTSSGGSPGKQGRFYYATDSQHLYYDFGTGWIDITPVTTIGAGSVTTAMLDAGVPIVPIGGMLDWPWAAAAIPSWALLPVGQSLTQAAYGALFTLASSGYPWGGSGTNFNLPDARARVMAGADNMGGTAAGRVTVGVSGSAGALGGIAGAEGVVLTTAQIPAHNHDYTPAVVTGSGPGSSGTLAAVGATAQTSNTGGGGAHSSVQPTLFVNKLMRVQ